MYGIRDDWISFTLCFCCRRLLERVEPAERALRAGLRLPEAVLVGLAFLKASSFLGVSRPYMNFVQFLGSAGSYWRTQTLRCG